VVVEALVDRGDEDRHVGVHAVDAPGAASGQTNSICCAPSSLILETAATAELPVASLGSTTITRRSCRFSGTLK
jgi:hypothetical protein